MANSGIARSLADMYMRNNAWQSFLNEDGEEEGYSCFDAENDIYEALKLKLFLLQPLVFVESVVN